MSSFLQLIMMMQQQQKQQLISLPAPLAPQHRYNMLLALFHRGIFKICHHTSTSPPMPPVYQNFREHRCLYHHLYYTGIQPPKTWRILSFQLLEKILLVIWYYKHLLLHCVHIAFFECWCCYGSMVLLILEAS